MQVEEENEKEIGLYIHIPFCKQKCYYCDFISFQNKENEIEEYINALKKEITKYALENKIMAEHKLERKYLLKTIYIGGGTPSYIDEKYIIDIMNIIKENFDIKEDAEITIEANPGTVTIDKMNAYKEIGINRLSIGLQATQDEILKEIGRIHTYSDFKNIFEIARNAGFQNINVDLMIGLPNQKIDNIKDSIKKLIKLNPEHISVYSLILEENTKLEELIKNKNLKLPDDDIERSMYWYIKLFLEKQGYKHYEISNYAKEGFESQHNLDCWNHKEYIGVGIAASSFIENIRYSNIKNIEEYIKNINNNDYNKNLVLEEKLSKESSMNEFMMLGLRKIQGVNISEFEQNFNVNPILKYSKQLKKLIDEKLIIIDNDRIYLSDRGIDLANIVWEEFV